MWVEERCSSGLRLLRALRMFGAVWKLDTVLAFSITPLIRTILARYQSCWKRNGLRLSFGEELWEKFLCLLLKRLVKCKRRYCVFKTGIFTSLSHQVVNTEAFFHLQIWWKIFYCQFWSWMFWHWYRFGGSDALTFFFFFLPSLENRDDFKICYDMYLHKTNHFPKIKLWISLDWIQLGMASQWLVEGKHNV